MITADFMTMLSERFENTNRSTLDDIESLVKTLSDTERTKLWDAFSDSYEYNTPPKRATFKKLMFKLNFTDKKEVVDTYGYCHECRVGYPNWTRLCPACGNELRIVIGQPDRYVPMQQQCGSCIKFSPTVRGASCQYYGRGSDSFQDKATQTKICKTCECFKCCYEEFIIRNRPSSYYEMKESGSFKGGHIPFENVTRDYKESINEAHEKIIF